jgi:hypothetical protein
MRCILLHLLLAGALAGQVVMVGFGKEVVVADPWLMGTTILEGYAAKYGLTPTEEELAPLRQKFGGAGAAARVIDFPMRILLNYKLNRVWWPKHQGRLVLSAFGVHLATDAMLREVEGMERRGEVKFFDAEVRRKFFEHFEKYGGDGVLRGEKARALLEEGIPK